MLTGVQVSPAITGEYIKYSPQKIGPGLIQEQSAGDDLRTAIIFVTWLYHVVPVVPIFLLLAHLFAFAGSRKEILHRAFVVSRFLLVGSPRVVSHALLCVEN